MEVREMYEVREGAVKVGVRVPGTEEQGDREGGGGEAAKDRERRRR